LPDPTTSFAHPTLFPHPHHPTLEVGHKTPTHVVLEKLIGIPHRRSPTRLSTGTAWFCAIFAPPSRSEWLTPLRFMPPCPSRTCAQCYLCHLKLLRRPQGGDNITLMFLALTGMHHSASSFVPIELCLSSTPRHLLWKTP
jgi:hypothetical protein